MLNNRFRSRIIFLILFLILNGLYRNLMGNTGISAFIAPALAGFSCIGLALAYRAYVQRGGPS